MIEEKKELYEKYQIPEYWIVDIKNQAIEVYTLDKEDYHLTDFATEEGIISSSVLAGLQVNVKEIFE
jgi:Uma2 family endonuclease